MSRRHCGLIFPPGTFQAPKFYWRGGDEFKEQEMLQAEYKQAKLEHSTVKRELEDLETKYNQAKTDLAYKDDQAVSLASALGGSSSSTGENTKLNKEIQQLTQELNEIEQKISVTLQRSQPVYMAQLEKEKSQIYVNVEQQSHDTDTTTRDIQKLSKEYFDLITSDNWLNSYEIISDHQIKAKERSKVRQEVNKLFENQNYGQEIKNEGTVRVRTTSNQHLDQLSKLIDQRDTLQNQLYHANHSRYMTQTTRNILVNSKLEILNNLNAALEELGLETNDVNALKEKYLPEAQSPSSPTAKRPSSHASYRSSNNPKTIRRPVSNTGRY